MKTYRYMLPHNMSIKVEAANETHARTLFAAILHRMGKFGLSADMRRGAAEIEIINDRAE